MVTHSVQISPGNDGQPNASPTAATSTDDARELARLRARVAELEAAQTAASPQAPTGRHDSTRSFVSAVLIIIACLLAPVSVLSVWASTVVSQTDRYVETVAPIADDPGVQAAIADEVTAAVMENLDVADVTTQALQVLSEQENMPPRVAAALPALAGPLTRGIEDFTRTQTGNFVASDQFQIVWAEVNRIAHAQLVDLLEGDTSGAITAQNNQITLNLGPVIEEVSARLVDQGFELAANVPAVDRTFVLAESEGIGQAQRFYGVLNTLGVWLPIVAVALLAAGVLLAADRRRALLRGSLGVAVAMIALGAGLTLVRTYYVETTPADILTADTAGNVFDMLVRFLRTSLRATGVLALLVALAAFVTGPAPFAVRIRSVVDRGIGHARGSADDAGWHLDTVGRWVYRYKSTLWMITFVVAGLALMFWDSPTVGDVVLVALIVIVVLAVIAFLGRPPLVRNVGEEPTERLPMGSSESAQPDDFEKRSSLAGEAATPSEAVETKP
ncbi:hypothetical protein GA707_15430 [Nostocoides sp. F2B08]|uniref:hypothetical protein n=1 Tax=Nostocoides sp. F2B08 TaxID=2653936 RepID=UPI001262E0A3|nr:hypothetical protein [Tetrasphaera sp. F2B08]KAB7743033.1 hypothetical protein GA707_15430 [Tetrasphaera sp. F2B08]